MCEDYQNLVSFKDNQDSESLEVFEFDRGLLQNLLMETDVLIITGQNPDEQRSLHINNDDLKLLEPGSLIIDLSLKNGDIINSSRETKPNEPSYIQNDLVYFSVTNLPSFVSKTSSNILSRNNPTFL